MPAPSHRRSFFRATGRAIGVCLLLTASVAAQEEANLGLSQMANKPRHSPAFVSFASSSYGAFQFKENDARASLVPTSVNFSSQSRSFNDYRSNTYRSGGTQFGPIYYVGNYGSVGDGSGDVVPQIADDLNGNGSSFFLVLADLNGDGSIDDDEIIGTITDFGDLYEFDTFFDEVRAKKYLRSNSLEVMKQHVFHSSPGVNIPTSGWRMEAFVDDWRIGFGDEVVATRPFDTAGLEPIHSKRLLEFLYGMKTSTYGAAGVRLNNFDSGFSFEGLGSILGRVAVDQSIDHTMIGPQLALGAVAESSIWRFEAIVMGMIGYERVKYEQNGVFGQELVPGALNRLTLDRTTTTIHDRDEDKFAWQAETRLTASCQLTHHWRFDATWRGFITGHVYEASEAVVYSAPSFGMQEPRADKAYGSDLFLGLTYLR